MNGWQVIHNGEVIATRYFLRRWSAYSVINDLIRHDGFPSDITVQPAR